MRAPKSILDNIDWVTVIIYLALVLIGWISVYASAYNEEHSSIIDFSEKYGKQLIWILSAVAIAFSIMISDVKFYTTFGYVIYGSVILLLVAVLAVGNKTAGAQSWFAIGSFKLQPSEFAKFATNLAVAKYLSGINVRFEDFKSKMMAFAIIAFPLLFILLQNDTGSALVFLSFILVFYREGLTVNILILGFLAIALFIMALVIDKYILTGILGLLVLIYYLTGKLNFKRLFRLVGLLALVLSFTLSVDYVFEKVLHPHQKDRINVLLGKEYDPYGTGYNVNQSKIAIGSGGFLGKGFLNGTQTKFDFVPEQSTDFIFCTVGEEWGFVGSLVVIVLFTGLILRIIYIAERQRSDFSRIYAYGVASILFIHFAINIGMTIGLIPVIGIPLPYFSYGGSSLWSFTILLFILVKLDANRLIMV